MIRRPTTLPTVTLLLLATSPALALARLAIRDIAGRPYRTYRHRQYSIAYPQNWQMDDAASTNVTFYPDGGFDSNAVSYGVIVSGFIPSPRTNNPEEAMRQLINNIRQADRSLRPQGKAQSFTLHGSRADRIDSLGNSPVNTNGRPLAECVRLVAMPYRGGEFLYLLFVAPDPDFKQLWPMFEQMLCSFQTR